MKWLSGMVDAMQQRVSTMPDVFRVVLGAPNVACCAH
jgi:hypothetical protein